MFNLKSYFDKVMAELLLKSRGYTLTVEEYNHYAKKLEELRVHLLVASFPNRE